MSAEENTELNQAEGFSVVRDGLPEMACVAPEPELSLWQRLVRWMERPICNL